MSLFRSGEVFVEILVLVVDEEGMFLELVVFAFQELVQLNQPGAVKCFTVLIVKNVKICNKIMFAKSLQVEDHD